MRHILFRGKTVDTHEWVYGLYYRQGGKAYIADNIVKFEVSDHTLGEYVGLDDRKNNKIFSDDHVVYWEQPAYHRQKEFIRKMIVIEYLVLPHMVGWNIKAPRASNNWEVIGNEIDNPGQDLNRAKKLKADKTFIPQDFEPETDPNISRG